MRTLAVIWRTAGLLLATSAESVREVLPPVAYSPCAGVPPWIRGLFMYRGQLLPLIDAARLLGEEPPADRMINRVLIVHMDAGTKAAPWPVGLWVESVLELDRIDFAPASSATGVSTHPGFATEVGRFLGPIAQTNWGPVQLVKPSEIFSPEQIEILNRRISEATENAEATA